MKTDCVIINPACAFLFSNYCLRYPPWATKMSHLISPLNFLSTAGTVGETARRTMILEVFQICFNFARNAKEAALVGHTATCFLPFQTCGKRACAHKDFCRSPLRVPFVTRFHAYGFTVKNAYASTFARCKGRVNHYILWGDVWRIMTCKERFDSKMRTALRLAA